jgi:hypothetical protein
MDYLYFVHRGLTGYEVRFPECVVLCGTWVDVLPAREIVSREYA